MTTDFTYPERVTHFFYAVGARLRLPFDVRSPRATLLWFELRHAATTLLNHWFSLTLEPPTYDGPPEIATPRETFEVRAGTRDAALVSPARERMDQLHLFGLIEHRAELGPVDFVDVGAGIGRYAVRVPKRTAADVRVWAVEDQPGRVALLERNLVRNDVHAVTVLPVALGDAASAGRTRRGDDVLPDLRPDSARVFKIDGDDPPAVLRGLRAVLGQGVSTDVCVRDDRDHAGVYDELHAQGFVRVRKHSPHNSWWTRGTHAIRPPDPM